MPALVFLKLKLRPSFGVKCDFCGKGRLAATVPNATSLDGPSKRTGIDGLQYSVRCRSKPEFFCLVSDSNHFRSRAISNGQEFFRQWEGGPPSCKDTLISGQN